MKLLAVLFAVFMIVASASPVFACGAGDHKDGDKVESMES